MSESIKLTKEEIFIYDNSDECVKNNFGLVYNVQFVNSKGLEIHWSKEQAKQLKKEILDNQEKAEKYNNLMNANSEIVQNNISHTKISSENKTLQERLEQIKKLYFDCIDNEDVFYPEYFNFEILKKILGNKS